MSANKNEWKCLYDKNGIPVYEGFTKKDKPCGAGTSYYPDGTIFQEGIFGVKGLLCGREYYPNGRLRFEGVYALNRNYGPNYPQYGSFQTEDGSYTYTGKFTVSFGGVGYPTVRKPEEFGPIQSYRNVPVLMWADENSGEDTNDSETRKDWDETMPYFDEFRKAVEDEYILMDDSECSRKYLSSDDTQQHIKSEYTRHVKRYKEGKITRNVFMHGCVNSTAYCLNLMME